MSLIKICILGWTGTDTLDDFGIFSLGYGGCDRRNIDLMPPIIAKVKPVAKDLVNAQSQRTDRGLGDIAIGVMARAKGHGEPVAFGLWIVGSGPSELELIHMLFFAIVGAENNSMQIGKGLISLDGDRAGHRGIFLEEFICDGSGGNEHIKGVKCVQVGGSDRIGWTAVDGTCRPDRGLAGRLGLAGLGLVGVNVGDYAFGEGGGLKFSGCSARIHEEAIDLDHPGEGVIPYGAGAGPIGVPLGDFEGIADEFGFALACARADAEGFVEVASADMGGLG